MERLDGRLFDQLRPVSLTPDFIQYPEGSVLIAMGETKVLCNASLQPGVPRWMESVGKEGGWITAEYSLLPRSTQKRTRRETTGLRGRTQEIKRMIGRSLRAGFDLELLGPRTCIVDCDVMQADGGTRTAAITGGYVALGLAFRKLVQAGDLPAEVFRPPVAAISVGLVDGQALLDLCYMEDVQADVDINVAMNARGHFIEVQGNAEGRPFSRDQMDQLLDLAEKGIKSLLEVQEEILNLPSG